MPLIHLRSMRRKFFAFLEVSLSLEDRLRFLDSHLVGFRVIGMHLASLHLVSSRFIGLGLVIPHLAGLCPISLCLVSSRVLHASRMTSSRMTHIGTSRRLARLKPSSQRVHD